jgi:hypothetical protein
MTQKSLRRITIPYFLVLIMTLGFGSCEKFENSYGERLVGRYAGQKHGMSCYPINSDTAISACSESTTYKELLIHKTQIRNHFAAVYDTIVHLGITYYTIDTFEITNYGEYPDGGIGASGEYVGSNRKRTGTIHFMKDTLIISCHELDGASSSFSFNFKGVKKE